MLSPLLALCEGNPLVTCGFPYNGSVVLSFDISFVVNLNKLLNENLSYLRHLDIRMTSLMSWNIFCADLSKSCNSRWWKSTVNWMEKSIPKLALQPRFYCYKQYWITRLDFLNTTKISWGILLLLTHCGPVTPYGDIYLGQHWFR